MVQRGILMGTESFTAASLVELAHSLESLGYDSLWLPELFGREPVATAGYLLGRTERIRVATGIANVYVRDAHCMAQTRRTLSELSGGRFIMGLGVSNATLNKTRGHAWRPPLEKMADYLEAMIAADAEARTTPGLGPLYVAAHGPKLQSLGASRSDGIITYLMPPEHTRQTRSRIGPSPALNVVCPFLAENDPELARASVRKQLRYYLTLDYYHREWRKLAFADADFADGGSDRLVDAIVAWGDAASLQARIAAYEQAGANRVIVMPLDAQRSGKPVTSTLQAAAPA